MPHKRSVVKGNPCSIPSMLFPCLPSLSLFLVFHPYSPSLTLRCQSLLPNSEVILHRHNYYDKKHNNN